jgi:hypothetical protein
MRLSEQRIPSRSQISKAAREKFSVYRRERMEMKQSAWGKPSNGPFRALGKIPVLPLERLNETEEERKGMAAD